MSGQFIYLASGMLLSAIPIAVAQDSGVVSGAEIAEYILVSPIEQLAEYCSTAVPDMQEEFSLAMDSLRHRIELAVEPYRMEINASASMSNETFAEFRKESVESAAFVLEWAQLEDPRTYCESFRKTLDASVDALRPLVEALIAQNLIGDTDEEADREFQ